MLQRDSANATAEHRSRVRAWNSGLVTWQDLEFLFGLNDGYPQFSGPEAIDAILTLSRRKWVPAKLIRLEGPDNLAQCDLDALLFNNRYYGSDHNQGPEKMSALHWLKSRGAHDLAAEGDYVAGRYDVAAEDLGIIVECGTTRLDKLLMTAMSRRWREFVLVPRGLKLGIVFNLTRRPFDRIRSIGEDSHDSIQYLARVRELPRITEASLARCVSETNDAFLEKYRKVADLIGRRVSPSYFFP